MKAATPLVERLLERVPHGPEEEARKESRVSILTEAADANGTHSSVSVQGRDPYGLTAVISTYGARRVLEQAGTSSGVLPPAELLEPRSFLDMLTAHGVAWNEHAADAG